MGDIIDISTKQKVSGDNNDEVEKELITKKREALKRLPSYRGEVLTKNNIRNLPDTRRGDIFWVGMDRCAYVIADKDGKKITLKALDENASISTGMTIYDLNKNIVSKEPIFNWEDDEKKKYLYEQFKQFIQKDAPAHYYLCYSRDLHYVTLFKVENNSDINERSFDIFCQTIEAIGNLISIDFHGDESEKSAEIWIRTADSLAELMYFFPYDNGLVKLTQ